MKQIKIIRSAVFNKEAALTAFMARIIQNVLNLKVVTTNTAEAGDGTAPVPSAE